MDHQSKYLKFAMVFLLENGFLKWWNDVVFSTFFPFDIFDLRNFGKSQNEWFLSPNFTELTYYQVFCNQKMVNLSSSTT